MSATSGGLYNPNPTQAIRDLTTSENTVSGIAATMAKATQAKPALMQRVQETPEGSGVEVTFELASGESSTHTFTVARR